MIGQGVAYPFYDSRWHNSSKTQLTDESYIEITEVMGDVVEIGGPTERGFRLLRYLEVLPSLPIITNVEGFWGTDPSNVDKLVDGKAMPFDNNSVGMFLASHIAGVDGFKKFDTVDSNDQNALDEFDEQSDEEYDLCLYDPTYKPEFNLRIGILQEMTRTLRPSGLILFEALGQRDVNIAEALGHTTIQQTVVPGNDDIFDCLFKKPE